MPIVTSQINIFSDELRHRQPMATSILRAAIEKGRLQQAYLLTGRSSDDKWLIVSALASYLNCLKIKQNKGTTCCFQPDLSENIWCLNCRWITNREHPQALLVLSDDSSKSGKIAVEKARELCDELAKSSQYYRIAVIENAAQDIFHRPAANALLKTIEEPKSTCLIFLFALTSDDVLATIVSRCQVIQLNSSNFEELGICSLRSPLEKLKTPNEQQLLQLEQAHSDLRASQVKTPYLGTIAYAEKLTDLLEDDITFDNLVDMVLTLEAQSLKTSRFGKLKITLYAKRLFDLCELTKLQVKHYVSKKAAVESFAFALRQLQMEFGIDK